MVRVAPGLTVSVIIPTLDEASRVGVLLEALRWSAVHEVIVSDGGSADDTVAIAQRAGARVVQGSRGRGAQLNAGAAVATGSVLWFVHADALPPPRGVAAIREALEDPAVVGGAFRLHTVPEHGGVPAPLLRVADLRSRITRYPYGDQGIFVRASAFDAMGGFAPVPIFEDLDFSQRLRRLGSVLTLAPNVRVSGRRFEASPLYYFALMNVFPALWRLGVDEGTLARWYHRVR